MKPKNAVCSRLPQILNQAARTESLASPACEVYLYQRSPGGVASANTVVFQLIIQSVRVAGENLRRLFDA